MTNGEATIAAQQAEIASLRAQLADANANAEQGWLACGAVRDEADDLKAQLATAREALSQMLVDPPASLDEPDMDAEVLVKFRQIALRALNATGGAQPNLEEPRG